MLVFQVEEKRYQMEIWIYTKYFGHGKGEVKYKRPFLFLISWKDN